MCLLLTAHRLKVLCVDDLVQEALEAHKNGEVMEPEPVAEPPATSDTMKSDQQLVGEGEKPGSAVSGAGEEVDMQGSASKLSEYQ